MSFLRHRRNVHPSARRRLFVEQLETRAVPASVIWIAGVDGDFEVAANWRDDLNVNRVPGANDNVSLGGLRVTADASHTVNSVNSGVLEIDAGTFQVNNANAGSGFQLGIVVEAGTTLRVNGGLFQTRSSEIFGTIQTQQFATFQFLGGLNTLRPGSLITGQANT